METWEIDLLIFTAQTEIGKFIEHETNLLNDMLIFDINMLEAKLKSVHLSHEIREGKIYT